MPIKLSATRVNTFLQCKQKYWFNYHDKLPKEESPAFKLGIAVHVALEMAGKIWLENEKFTKINYKEIKDEYIKTTIKEGINSLAVIDEGWKLIEKRLDSFKMGKKIIGLEIAFGNDEIQVSTDEGVPLIGAIDKAIEVDDTTLLIVDYKTSKTAPTIDQLQSDIQLSIYDLVAAKLWPQYKRRILCLDLLKSDLLYSYRTDESRKEFSNYLYSVWNSMNNLKETDVKPSLNIFCGWCDYRDYCTAYKTARSSTNFTFGSIIEMTSAELIGERDRVGNIKKILEARERELNSVVLEKIKKFGEEVSTDEEELYIRQNARTNYDAEMVSKEIPYDAFVKMVSINNKALEDYIEKNPMVREGLIGAAQTNFTTPFIMSKKLKKGKKL